MNTKTEKYFCFHKNIYQCHFSVHSALTIIRPIISKFTILQFVILKCSFNQLNALCV